MACAKWLVRNGAWIRWAGEETFHKDLDDFGIDGIFEKVAKGRTNIGGKTLVKGRRGLKNDPNASKDAGYLAMMTLGERENALNSNTLEEIYAEDASLTWRGFYYLGKLNHVLSLIFIHYWLFGLFCASLNIIQFTNFTQCHCTVQAMACMYMYGQW